MSGWPSATLITMIRDHNTSATPILLEEENKAASMLIKRIPSIDRDHGAA
jgi:hypothetical protein